MLKYFDNNLNEKNAYILISNIPYLYDKLILDDNDFFSYIMENIDVYFKSTDRNIFYKYKRIFKENTQV